jgi:hypothetical protein
MTCSVLLVVLAVEGDGCVTGIGMHFLVSVVTFYGQLVVFVSCQ